MASMLRASFRVASSSHCRNFLNITWRDGAQSQFPNIWLRGSVRDPKYFDSNSCLYNHKDLVRFITHESPILHVENDQENEALNVHWEDHSSTFDSSWLRAKDLANSEHLYKKPEPILWDADSQMPVYHFSERRDKLESWLTDLRRYGLVYFEEVPPKREGLEKILHCIGQTMQRPHPNDVLVITADSKKVKSIDANVYGRSDHAFHVDNTYFDTPSRISAFVGTQYSAPVEDTVNYFVDNLKIMEEIRCEEPEAYELLSTIPVGLSRRRLASDETDPEKTSMYHHDSKVNRHLISLDYHDDGRPTLLYSTKYSGIDLGLIKDSSTVKKYYESFIFLESKIYDPKNHQKIVIKEGTAAIANNYRVSHGRGPIHPATQRTIMVAFITEEMWRSRWRVINGEKSGLENKWLFGCSETELEILANRYDSLE